nr:probable LRR receptor-like serine/threonine-protein kinase At3g47570 [Ziziphus jujuba var. spinosa]
MSPVFGGNNHTDRLSLLAIKAQLQDPLGVLNSWNASQQFCQWPGVTCSPRHRRVTVLDLHSYKLKGKVPSLASLSKLRSLHIGLNNLGFHKDDDLNFITSLVNCTKLDTLQISFNNFEASLPESVSNLSTNLELLSLASNLIRGSIPTDIGNLINLEVLIMDHNQLTGPIPTSIVKLQKLYWMVMDKNKLSGVIPSSLGNLTWLNKVLLASNNLQGSIPSSLGGCKSLTLMDLSQNNLTGPIPKQLIGLSSLSEGLDLSKNRLTGPIPMEVGNLANTPYLGLAENKLTGEIPETLGEVPIQGVFSNTSALSIVGNARLCGGIPELNLSSCSTNLYKKHKHSLKVKIIIVSVACGLVALIVMVLLLIFSAWRKRSKSANLGLSFGISFVQVSYGDLFRATDGFSEGNMIGAGSFGSVYKGILNQRETKVVAVKVLNLGTSRASKSFVAECKALKRIKHRNLVRVITACSSIDFQGNDFKALVYEFMINGSLEEWLHPYHRTSMEEEHKNLSLIERVNISLGVANALDYLHNQCHVPIVHCDLKPSNVLLDSDMNAHLGHFGLVRFLPDASHSFSSEQTSSLRVRGSIGYTAPEYGMGSKVSKSGDIYSYGILLLELFTGKRPTDIMFTEGMNLHNFALMGLSNSVEEITDAALLQTEDEISSNTNCNRNRAQNQRIRILDCLISVIKIGVACSSEMEKERMDIAKVVSELCHIKERLVRT